MVFIQFTKYWYFVSVYRLEPAIDTLLYFTNGVVGGLVEVINQHFTIANELKHVIYLEQRKFHILSHSEVFANDLFKY